MKTYKSILHKLDDDSAVQILPQQDQPLLEKIYIVGGNVLLRAFGELAQKVFTQLSKVVCHRLLSEQLH